MKEQVLLSESNQIRLLRAAMIPYMTRLETDQALIYLNLKQPKHLKQLVDEGFLKRHGHVGRTFCYKKEELDTARIAIDKKLILLK